MYVYPMLMPLWWLEYTSLPVHNVYPTPTCDRTSRIAGTVRVEQAEGVNMYLYIRRFATLHHVFIVYGCFVWEIG